MEFIYDLKLHLRENDLEKILSIELTCFKLLSEVLSSYDKARDKFAQDKFAQCILTDEIKSKIISSEKEMVIAGRYVNFLAIKSYFIFYK